MLNTAAATAAVVVVVVDRSEVDDENALTPGRDMSRLWWLWTSKCDGIMDTTSNTTFSRSWPS